MELTFRPFLEYVSARLVELRIKLAKIVVDGRGAENAYALALLLVVFEYLCLYDDAETFHEKDAT